MRTAKYDKLIQVGYEINTIAEWAEINEEKPITIYNRNRRVDQGLANYNNAQIVGSEELPQPKESKNIKPETYKKRDNKKATFDGSRLMLEFSRYQMKMFGKEYAKNHEQL